MKGVKESCGWERRISPRRIAANGSSSAVRVGGTAGVVRRVPVFGAGEGGELHQVRHSDRTVVAVDHVQTDPEVACDEAASGLGHRTFDLDPDEVDRFAASPRSLPLRSGVGSLVLLDLQVGVARDPKRVGREDDEAGKEQVEVGRDQVFKEDELPGAGEGLRSFRIRRTAISRGWADRNLETREPVAVFGVVNHDREVEREVRDEWERVRGVEGKSGVRTGKISDSKNLRRRPSIPGPDPRSARIRIPAPSRRGRRSSFQHCSAECRRGIKLSDLSQLLPGGHAVGGRLDETFETLPLKAGHPDHERNSSELLAKIARNLIRSRAGAKCRVPRRAPAG